VNAPLEQFRMLIGGKAVDAMSGRTFESENPYTGRPWAVIPDAGPEDVDAAVEAARAALDGEWGELTGFDRSRLMRLLGDLISVNAERLAHLEVQDSGKLYREMIGQLNGLGGWYHYYAGLADKLEGRQIPAPNPDYLVYTRREPVGVVAAITPWNSPLMLMTWKLAPALAAGCTVVIKPSEHAPASTLGFAELIAAAGSRPAWSTSSPASHVRSARRSPGTRGWTRWRSPGRRPRAARWPTRRPRTSIRSPWSWAASPRRSSSLTRTWPPRRTASWPACSRPPARPAWRARG
jgi:hypothetical protein